MLTADSSQINSLLKDRVVQAENESALRKRAEEQVTRGSRELRDAQKRSSLVGSGGVAESSDVEELRRYNADLSVRPFPPLELPLIVVQKMLKCSTCNLRFKGAIINRCGHLFCKECIEARLSNRARKCPTCQAPFGQADVTAVRPNSLSSDAALTINRSSSRSPCSPLWPHRCACTQCQTSALISILVASLWYNIATSNHSFVSCCEKRRPIPPIIPFPLLLLPLLLPLVP